MNGETLDQQQDQYLASREWILAEFKRVAGRRVSKRWPKARKEATLRELTLRVRQVVMEHSRFYKREIES